MENCTRTFARSLFAVAVSLCSAGCPGPRLSDVVRPADPTAAEARGSQSVYVIEAQGQPLIVDWQPEQRGDLEVAMREGIAIVGFDSKGLRLLKDCHISGKYGFIGVNTKEQVVRLISDDEVKANLPADALGIIAKIGGELGTSQALDIAIVMVGKKKTTWANAAKSELVGNCAGATHFVRGATIGAFAMRSGAKGRARTVAEIFGAGVSASTGSEKTVQNADGLLDACRKASPESESPPTQCGALIRLELTKLGNKVAAKPQAEPAANVGSEAQACPPGFVYAQGKCTRAASVAHHACRQGDVRDCTIQCEKGNAESCNTLGVMFVVGEGVATNKAEAAQLFAKSCDSGLAAACGNVGFLKLNGDGVPKDAAGALTSFVKACGDGHATSCTAAAKQLFFARGVPKDENRAVKLWFHGCKGGDKFACSDLGFMVMGNVGGLKRDDKLASSLFKMACDGGVTVGCTNFAYTVEFGKGVPKDENLANSMYEKACGVDAAECIWSGITALSGIGRPKDVQRARADFQKSCDRAQPSGGSAEAVACVVLNELFAGKNSVNLQGLKDGAEAWKATCAGGAERDCALLGVAVLGVGNRDLAKQVFAQACKMGDRWACDLGAHPKIR